MDDTAANQRQRVLVLAPTKRDAAFCRTILTEASISTTLCSDIPEICREMEKEAAAAILTEESLNPADLQCVLEVLHRQPVWSDFPLLVLTQEGAASEMALRVLETLGNVTLLERPVRVPTLVSAVRTAIRARARQYQIRDLLRVASQTADTLREEAARKDEFLAMLAHELRNPLAPIRNGLAIIRLNASSKDECEPLLGMMERQVTHLVRLVDDLLDVSRILRGRVTLQMETLDLPTVIRGAVDTARPLIDAQRHELILSFAEEPMHVEGDAIRLAQVFANLINNAAKYTDPGGRIAVKVERRDHWLAVTVQDNGIGITPEMLNRVFDLFSQAQRSIDRSQGGLGLGLTIVKRLVEMHGGAVHVASPGLGKGSQFTVQLPASTRQRTQRTENSRDASLSASVTRRILIVDDNHDAADSLARLLRAQGHDVHTRYDGLSAVEATAHLDPDIVLLDIGLPGMNGYEVARTLRDKHDDLLLIAVTGYGREEDRAAAQRSGFDHHLVKPVDLSSLDGVLAESARS